MFYDVNQTREENAAKNQQTVHNTNVLRYATQAITLIAGGLGLIVLLRNIKRG
jgi:hypothetical protein